MSTLQTGSMTTSANDGAPAVAVGRRELGSYLLALSACALTTLIAAPLSSYFDLANIVMVFLLVVVLVAVRLGRGPAVTAAFVSVALFDFFLVPPRLSFAVNDAQYLLTFAIMLTVALITGQLTAGLKVQAQLASVREQRAGALYEMSRELAGALSLDQVIAICQRFVAAVIQAESCLVLPDDAGQLQVVGSGGQTAHWIKPDMARMAFDGGACTDLDAASAVGYFALRAPTRVRGVLAVTFHSDSTARLLEHHSLLEAVASLAAIAIERLHYVDVANKTELQMVAERLRSSVLSAVSHDLRTPLTALVGLADALAAGRPALADHQRESAEAIRDQAVRLSGLVGNLLDMARLNAGAVKLRKEWQPLEEVIGSSIKLLERNLAAHPVSVALPADLPLLEFDAVLIERVFCNLIENAAKYATPHTPIEISARVQDAFVQITVSDSGRGIPLKPDIDIFQMFVRGTRESAEPGIGLGLAICRAIVEAHLGTITAHNREQGGACFMFTLPRGNPPVVELDDTPAIARDG
jgi:two-component system sensor histidine kinase KdpD